MFEINKFRKKKVAHHEKELRKINLLKGSFYRMPLVSF